MSTTTALPVPAARPEQPVFTFVRDRHYFMLVDEAILRGPPPWRPVYVAIAQSPATAQSLSRWFDARRGAWQEWAAYAVAQGPIALGLLIDTLMDASPPTAVPNAFTVRAVPGDACALVLVGHFAEIGPRRTAELWRGHFPDRATRERALRWLHRGDMVRRWEELADMAEQKGASTLQAFVDAGLVRAARGRHR